MSSINQAISITLIFLLCSCTPTEYNEKVQVSFLDQCVKAGSLSLSECTCLYDGIKQNVPFEKFYSAEQYAVDRKALPATYRKSIEPIAIQCLKKRTPAELLK